MKKKQKKKNKSHKEQKRFWNIVVGTLLVLYLVITAAIFEVRKRIRILESKKAPGTEMVSHEPLSSSEKERKLQEKLATEPENIEIIKEAGHLR